MFTVVQFECGETVVATKTFGPFGTTLEAHVYAQNLFPGLSVDEYGRGVTEDGDPVYQVTPLSK